MLAYSEYAQVRTSHVLLFSTSVKEYAQPSIELWGFILNEPVTVLTDLLIAGVCYYAYIKLKRTDSPGPVRKFFMYYMLLMGVATAIGGIVGHGLMNYLDFFWKTPGWLLSMLSIALFERAAIYYARPLISENLGRFFGWLNIIELLTFIFLSYSTLNFWYVQIHAAYGLVIVVSGFNALVYFKKKDRGSLTLLVGVAWSAVAAVFYYFKWGIGLWFTHFDVCHVFMAISSLYFFFGCRRILKDPYAPLPT